MQPPGALTADDAALFTDLYELTMAQGYFRQGMSSEASFSLFVRPSRVRRSYLVSAGLEDVLRYLHGFRFTPSAIDYLRSTGTFAADFLDFLGRCGSPAAFGPFPRDGSTSTTSRSWRSPPPSSRPRSSRRWSSTRSTSRASSPPRPPDARGPPVAGR